MASDRKRLFFALWPEEEARARLAELQACLPQHQGRWVHPSDLHVTLRFLGSVAPGRQACVAEAAAAVSGESFELVVDHLDFWPRPRIVLAGTRETPPPLAELVETLGDHLEACGFPPEKRPYRPHVTLLRHTTPMASRPLEAPIRWFVDHFVLVESRPGGDPPWYRPLEGWALGG